MASVFSSIIHGDLPGRFVYRDDRCVAFLTIELLTPGHTLVVPVDEVDHWLDLAEDLAAHLMVVAQRVGRALDELFGPKKVALLIAGLEVPHTHLHIVAIESERDLDFRNADRAPDPENLNRIAEQLTAALQR